MSVTIYVEGGGKDNHDTRARCKEGFAEYCKKLAPLNRCPRIVVCGGRNDAFHRFEIAIGASRDGDHCALLVDSEGPVQPGKDPAEFLHDCQGWHFPPRQHHRVFFMVQAMEAWLLADRDTLADYYGPGFRANALRGDEHRVETIPKDDLEPSLTQATRDTQKGGYHKTRHAYDLLAKIDPQKVESASLRAKDFHDFLRSL